MPWIIRVGLVLSILLVAAGPSASFEGWSGGFIQWWGPAYYHPGWSKYPVPCGPQPPMYAPNSLPAKMPTAQSPLAQPWPGSDPLRTEPAKRAPAINEARTLGGNYAANKAAKATAKDICRVGFWNATGRDLQLTVDGMARPLVRDRAVTLDLSRSFTWRVDQGQSQTVNVPPGQAVFEVIIRE